MFNHLKKEKLIMAHAVESMMYKGEVPWHGLGKQVHGDLTTGEAIVEAGLDWSVSMQPLYLGADQGGAQVNHRAIVRDTDKRVFGVMGPDYVPLQNKEAFKFFDPFLTNKEASIDTAGALRGGQNIWVLARLNRDPIEVVKNDPVEKFILLSNSHRGGIAVKVGFTPIRVVCANTLAIAEGAGSKLLRVAHSNQMITNLEAIQEIMNAANARFEATAEQYKFLASREVSQGDLKKYVHQVFIRKEVKTERAKLRAQEMEDTIKRLFETGLGNDTKQARGTYWALYNAATQYLTHEQKKTAESRLDNLWFKRNGIKTNSDALAVAVNMAGV